MKSSSSVGIFDEILMYKCFANRFTFKVSILAEDGFVILESYSHALTTKKAAAEDAAEGALWCLKHMSI